MENRGVNDNSCCKPTVTKEGKQSYEIVFLKYKKGGYIQGRSLLTPHKSSSSSSSTTDMKLASSTHMHARVCRYVRIVFTQ